MNQTESASSRAKPHALFLPHLDVLAHTGRSVLVARELSRRGWQITFAGSGKYASLPAEEAFNVEPLPEMPAAQIVSESLRGRRWPFHSASQIRPFVAAEVDLLKRLRPSVVVFDHRYTASTSAEIARLPRVSITNVWWTPYDAVGMGLPRTHPLFVTAPWLLPLRRVALARRGGTALARLMFARWATPYNVVRAEYGLPPLSSILDLFTGDACILPDTPQLAPVINLPASHHYVGPLVWEPKGILPAELQSLEPYVYVTMGSSADPQVFDVVVEAMKQLDGTPAVITTGGVRKPHEFAGLPARIRLYDFLPGSLAASGASLVVCQGGIGTIYQALAAGKPLVGIPFMPEQEVYGIGAVERLGAGISVPARHLNPRRLLAAVTKVQSDHSFALAAERLRPAIDLHSGPGRAADVIESAVHAGK